MLVGLSHAFAISSVRVLCEHLLWRRAADINTPARISALIHGFVCCVLLWQDKWGDAVGATGLFFVLDIVFNECAQGLTWDMMVHHLMGAVLCGFSVWTESFDLKHVGAPLTRALILLETTNPLLHFLTVLRRERIQLDVWVTRALTFMFFLQFLWIRILNLGQALIQTFPLLKQSEDWAVQGIFFVCLCMWALQFVWLRKLIQAIRT